MRGAALLEDDEKGAVNVVSVWVHGKMTYKEMLIRGWHAKAREWLRWLRGLFACK
jgi:hypothetical protein